MTIKQRSIEEIRRDLQQAKDLLKDVQERGNAAICKEDLEMGYDADFYLHKCPMLRCHVSHYQHELAEATRCGVQPSLFG